MENSGYEIMHYLHATAGQRQLTWLPREISAAPERNAYWIGYVAVSDDEKSTVLGRLDITIAWRGTKTRLELVEDFKDLLRPIARRQDLVKIVSGFLDLYTGKNEGCRFCKYSAREQILTEVKQLMEMYPDEEMSITITGHSLGGALAIVSGYENPDP